MNNTVENNTNDQQQQGQQPGQPQVIYANLSGDDEPTVIESLCVNCHEQGKTTILLTKIPYFKDVIIMSFNCDECGFKNNEVQTGAIQEKGAKIRLRLTNKKDLNRDLVKSEHCTVKIPELDFEYPAATKKAVINTVEGLIQNFIDGIEQDQEERRKIDAAVADQLDAFIKRLEKLRDGEGFPFTLIFDDPSGNSYIKNPFMPSSDPEMKIERYYATKEQLEAMGFDPKNAIEERKTQAKDDDLSHKDQLAQAHKILDFSAPLDDNQDLKGETLSFVTPCHACHQMGENKMCTISVPYFKELIVMAFTCDSCGAKSREIKTGGEISQKARRITLKVEKEDDLQRDVFKSETSVFKIPELDIELMAGTLGGVFTTVEGLLSQVYENLTKNNPIFGDSADPDLKSKMTTILDKLNGYKDFKDQEKFTVILDDPLSNCFVLNPFYPKEDPQIKVEVYDRTFDQNEELGINDMKTDNY